MNYVMMLLAFFCVVSVVVGQRYNGNCNSANDCAAGEVCIRPGNLMNANAKSQHKCTPCLCTYPSQCYVNNNAIMCNCSGFGTTGSLCQFDIDECDSDPCQNGGTCFNGVNMYICQCPAGWSGVNCEINVDDCSDEPCQNGGTCVDGDGVYACICPTGYCGNDCEIDIDNCTPDPCYNGGTCVSAANTYACVCPAGFTGTNCETDVTTCGSVSECLNGGTCQCACDCSAGFFGEDCSQSSLSSIACEGTQLQISCPAGQTIQVISANFGRTADGSVCPHASILTTSCFTANSLSIVSAACDGLQSCQVSASNSVFGDPCSGTYKYLEVEYTCLETSPI